MGGMGALWVLLSLLTGDDPSEADVQVRAQAWLAVPKGWLEITRGSRPGTATHADVGSDIALDPDVAPVLEAQMRLSGPHGAGIRFAQINAEGSGSADESFIYHGEVLDAGRQVRTELDFLMLEGDYQFAFNRGDELEVTAHAGARFWSFSGRVSTVDAGPAISTQRGFDSGFWMAGLDVAWKATGGLELGALVVGGLEGSSRYFWKAEGDVLLRLGASISLTAGCRIDVTRFHQSTNESNLKFFGPTLGLGVSF